MEAIKSELELQVKRIKSKLILARKADKKFKIFGAYGHKYKISKPISTDLVAAVERKYGFQLPACYKTFITQIGNGGKANGHAAGPFHGIYSLQKSINEVDGFNGPDGPQRACIIYPYISEDDWQKQTYTIENNDLNDEEYDNELTRLYGGILLIGSQGCAFVTGLVLNGEHKGKIVNLSFDRALPKFTFEDNFLDWYERWLDEVISGDLLEWENGWFGYTVSGSEKQLLEKYFMSECEGYKCRCLESLLMKSRTISTETFHILENQYHLNEGDLKRICLEIMVKFNYLQTKTYLHEYFDIEPEFVIELLYLYGKGKIEEWIEILYAFVPSIKDSSIFGYFVNILKNNKINNYQIILPFTTYEDNSMRLIAFSALTSLDNKTKQTLINYFIAGLTDSNVDVIYHVLSALKGIVDNRLLKYYQEIARKISEKEEYQSLTYRLNDCLTDFNLTNETILNIDAENYKIRKWFQFWKK